jgi:sulfotransferase 6B1
MSPSSDAPPVLINTIPKSGTHLLKRVLPTLNAGTLLPLELYEGWPNQLKSHEAHLAMLPPGAVIAGHVFHSDAYAAMLERLGIRMVLGTRDPRDIVVSLVRFYETTEWPKDPPAEHIRNCLHCRTDRLRATIIGFEHERVTQCDIATWVRRFIPWAQWPGAFAVRFENLVEPELRPTVLRHILTHVTSDLTEDEVVERLSLAETAIDSERSPTFRGIHVSAWHDAFDPLTRSLFDLVADNLLTEMGYDDTPDR